MAKTLQSQLHFVKDVQGVDTGGIEPLRSIRDETQVGLDEQTVGLKELQTALAQERAVGHKRRPRRLKQITLPETQNWEPLASTSQKAGGYFIVRSKLKL